MTNGTTQLDVVARRRIARDVVELELRHPGDERLPDWAPGAHVALTLPNGMVRPYSLCGDRWDAYSFVVAVRRDAEGAGGSAFVHDRLAVGDTVRVGAPRTSFPLVPGRTCTFVAGGIGITPFLSMMQAAERLDMPYRLLYVGRDVGTMPYLHDLLDGPHAGSLEVFTTATGGRPDLAEAIGPVAAGDRVYVCGPPGLAARVEEIGRAWPAHTLRTESFGCRTGLDTDEPFTAELRRTGRTLTVPRTSTLLEAIHASGVTVMSSCLTGTCGACETPVLEGAVDHRDTILVDGEDGVMFPCVSRARDESVVLDL
ncbi:PDR/VanB family oxidoreductase [Isoptericola sp. 178]|uniref:PDR/VanB family oxidoreductase n=1 Tax=Isoptericola sp. 178 TaxID=3064651 RepID=UPI0027124A36|nr:PDR/VanB family oxidoreductase [Isoptericola sp. 178]MDO8143837.1 PDR/VanB family oxidoreductase [Isoptericola sp. 178]